MKFTEQKAQEVQKRFNVNPATVRVWRHRGRIPDKYFEVDPRVRLTEMIQQVKLDAVIEKYGDEIKRLLNTRKFKANQKHSYYSMCLFSLCKEAGKSNI